MVRAPSGIRNYMGGTNPIMVVNNPLIPVKMNMQLPEVAINKDVETIAGFIIHGACLRSNSQKAFDTLCGGDMCDKNSMYKDGRVSPRCVCYAMSNGRTFLPGMALNIKVAERTGNTFEAFDYSSQYFLQTYIFKGKFPLGTRESTLSHWEMDGAIMNTVDGVFDRVNQEGGWSIIGWTKMGLVKDEAAPEGPKGAFNGQNEEAKIEAGTLNYHITSLLPSTPQAINTAAMESFRIDLMRTARGDGAANDIG